MKKIYVVSIVLFIVGVGGLYWLSYSSRQDEPANDAMKSTQPETSTVDASTSKKMAEDKTISKLIIGSPDAPVTIIEYSDYKCPECNKLYQGAGKDIRKQYVDTGKANIEFRPFPLFGEDSGLALYASYCAAEQGKFTAYHDRLFDFMWQNYYKDGDYSVESKQIFSIEKLGKLAGEAGLDKASFTTCAGGKTYGDTYNAAVALAGPDSVQATPSIIIGARKVTGPQPFSTYDALLKIETR